jgi:RNA polymerase sigma factor (sigma-70 family)
MTKEELLKKYIKLAYKLAGPFYKGFPNHAEDIKSAALEGLCRAINVIIKGNKYEFAGAIIYLHIRGHIFNEINKIPFIRIPVSYIKRHKLFCYEHNLIFRIKDLYPEVFNDLESSSTEGHYHNKLKTLIKNLHLNDEELSVLDLRLEDQTVREIATELVCSKSKVQKIIERIRHKWRKYEDTYRY